MDPSHRDRVAFMRINSGTLSEACKSPISDFRSHSVLNSQQPCSTDRDTVDEGYLGDVLGLVNASDLE